ncbi:uncharacterized protein FPRO_09033 [Fusarium proliferatum ET1]|uniref:Uncharacterized protein n=1 Tax=Fusarium proliferatum (strain ET1) TaxID=1227346 RepID=A0A1L7W9E4_FUSPR|nr:uncharacterized protein FPRO_09033 [Fusarium proliferatum ET1]CZR49226.1 uncharacterized protein FPRO_09033 [Fusarium proliferatum ET1]
MPTLLEALTKRNVAVNSQAVVGGSNTTTETYIEPGGWRMWDEFNYDTLTRIFRRKLASEYRGSSEPRALELGLIVSNEETLEDLLRRFFANILPGDTKLDAKWSPWMSEDTGRYRTRYGFIITDANLVALRITRELIGAGLAQTRPRREAAVFVGHQRHSSDATMGSGDGSSSVYSDDSPLEWSYHDPEYAIIPWNAHGKEVLTIKLALWSLIMMATSGDRGIDYSYPPLDSWRFNGERYVHNTSGTTKSELSEGDHLLLEPNDMSWEGDAHYTQSQDVDDMLPSTRAGGTSSVGPSQAYQPIEVEASVRGSSRQADQGPDDDDQKTEVGPSHRHHKRKKVRIEEHLVTRKLYYLNANGDKVDTSRAQ